MSVAGFEFHDVLGLQQHSPVRLGVDVSSASVQGEHSSCKHLPPIVLLLARRCAFLSDFSDGSAEPDLVALGITGERQAVLVKDDALLREDALLVERVVDDVAAALGLRSLYVAPDDANPHHRVDLERRRDLVLDGADDGAVHRGCTVALPCLLAMRDPREEVLGLLCADDVDNGPEVVGLRREGERVDDVLLLVLKFGRVHRAQILGRRRGKVVEELADRRDGAVTRGRLRRVHLYGVIVEVDTYLLVEPPDGGEARPPVGAVEEQIGAVVSAETLLAFRQSLVEESESRHQLALLRHPWHEQLVPEAADGL